MYFVDLSNCFYVLFQQSNEPGTVQFDNYKEFLLYVYNTIHASGKVDEIIDKVRSQPKTRPFDYNYNTQEGT